MKPIIEVRGISKRYKLGQIQGYKTIRESLSNLFRTHKSLSPKGRGEGEGVKAGEGEHKSSPLAGEARWWGSSDFIWALKDVSFDVQSGEVLGIIGRNGSGKSTLLKILTRITEPTEGTAHLRGQVASLLEVGTGFHPELTGRENVYLNGAILGMHKADIDKKFDEIIAFSGVEKFLDTPVKRYSSGMHVRLAFAVAAHLEPKILLVDEVLAVGDGEFQKKCLGKMEEVSKQYGRTVLFVSHNMPMIASLCSRCILLNDGRIQATGNPGEVIANYQYGGQNSPAFVDYTNTSKKPGDNMGTLLSSWVENESGKKSLNVMINQPFRICMRYRVLKDVSKTPYPNFHLFDSQGQYVFVTSPNDLDYKKPFKAGEYLAVCEIPANFLNDGLFSVGLALTFIHSGMHISFYEKHALVFNVSDPLDGVPTRTAGYGGRVPGIIRPILKWTLETI